VIVAVAGTGGTVPAVVPHRCLSGSCLREGKHERCRDTVAIGLVCLIGALVGRETKVIGNELPDLAPHARIALAVVGALALIFGTVTFVATTWSNVVSEVSKSGQIPNPNQAVPAFMAPVKWSESMCWPGESCTVGDVNGDGRVDAIAFVQGSGTDPALQKKTWVALSTG
jgi:hypothetical protein